jgi:hypothetical protein
MRRGLLAALALAACAAQAQAQAPARPVTALGVFSLLGDGIELTVAAAPTDTRIDRARRETLAVPNIGFDRIVGAEVRRHFAAERPQAEVRSYAVGTLPAAEQRIIAQSAKEGALPEWMIKAVQERRLSHVLLITRQLAAVNLRTADQYAVGSGRVDGIGFYLDANASTRNVDTGAVANGHLGVHVVYTLSLMDTDSATVVRSHTVNDQYLVAPPKVIVTTDPWSFLTPAEKIELLRDMIARNTRRVLPELFKGL